MPIGFHFGIPLIFWRPHCKYYLGKRWGKIYDRWCVENYSRLDCENYYCSNIVYVTSSSVTHDIIYPQLMILSTR